MSLSKKEWVGMGIYHFSFWLNSQPSNINVKMIITVDDESIDSARQIAHSYMTQHYRENWNPA